MDLFAQNLRTRAKELGLSHAEIARRAGLEVRRYSHYVCGTREPDLATFLRIAKTLGTTPNALLGMGTRETGSRKDVLKDRLNTAADAMDERQLEIAVVQVESMVVAGGR